MLQGNEFVKSFVEVILLALHVGGVKLSLLDNLIVYLVRILCGILVSIYCTTCFEFCKYYLNCIGMGKMLFNVI